jgi:hypothetical protein
MSEGQRAAPSTAPVKGPAFSKAWHACGTCCPGLDNTELRKRGLLKLTTVFRLDEKGLAQSSALHMQIPQESEQDADTQGATATSSNMRVLHSRW